MKKGKWFFRISVCESKDTYSVMVSFWNMYKRDKMYVRFFSTNEATVAFTELLVAGKYDKELDSTED